MITIAIQRSMNRPGEAAVPINEWFTMPTYSQYRHGDLEQANRDLAALRRKYKGSLFRLVKIEVHVFGA